MRRKSDYGYELPSELIAQAPTAARDGSRLLRVGPERVQDAAFVEILQFLPDDAVVVVNDTRVIPARLHARKDTGGAVELLLLAPTGEPGRWRAMARSSKPVRRGARLRVVRPRAAPESLVAPELPESPELPELQVTADRDADGLVEVELPGDALGLLGQYGELPLPPYIARHGGNEQGDRERYQTVFAREPGAVAAPTAGLHFTDALLDGLRARGCTVTPVTLHVGLGTFSPIRTEDLQAHRMHSERYEIPPSTAELVASGRPVVAVGTTSVRALEASAAAHGQVLAGSASTRLFIRDDYRFRVVDHLLTNFHLPESTLLMLVCAFAGYDRVMAAYRHAVAGGYRFYSYGDAMLLDRRVC